MAEHLEESIARAGSPVELLRNTDYPSFTFPIAAEFTNWRDEQRAWHRSVALMDQSHHMTDLFLEGPDVLELLSGLAVNTFRNFTVDVAKQLIGVNRDGYVIGDGILFYLDENRLDLVGHHVLSDWVRYNIDTSDLDVTYRLDGNSAVREGDPVFYRYELQGPNALALIENVTGEAVPEVKFFHMTSFRIAGRDVRALRHGMAGQPGFELFGPWEDGEAVRGALMEAGEPLGIRAVGAKAYSSTPLESGWIPTPLPAIFGEDMREYRKWLPAARVGSLAGSFYSQDIEDYYLTPYDLGYGRSVKFDHEFVGRSALQELADGPKKRKVTLVWNADDVADVVKSQLTPGTPAKFLDFPKSRYGFYQYDSVLVDGRPAGVSTDVGYVTDAQIYCSLASIDEDRAQDGTEVEVLWGEDPISKKAQVEEHRQTTIRATVAPAPYDAYARSTYRDT